METTETHQFMTDRYAFDFKTCTPKKGYAQVDTTQDAHYYGHWANPFKLEFIGYVEGDISVQKAADVDEFVECVKSFVSWCDETGWSFLGIDPMLKKDLEDRFKEIGLGDYLHGSVMLEQRRRKERMTKLSKYVKTSVDTMLERVNNLEYSIGDRDETELIKSIKEMHKNLDEYVYYSNYPEKHPKMG